MCKKGFARMWILRRLENLGASRNELLDTYKHQILSVMEYAAPAWTSGLTKTQSDQIERVQRTAVYIILGDEFTSYKRGLKLLCLDTLQKRRTKLCKKFTIKASNYEKFSLWFVKNDQIDSKTRSRKKPYKVVQTRTTKYKKSPLPYMTDLLNLQTQNTF